MNAHPLIKTIDPQYGEIFLLDPNRQPPHLPIERECLMCQRLIPHERIRRWPRIQTCSVSCNNQFDARGGYRGRV